MSEQKMHILAQRKPIDKNHNMVFGAIDLGTNNCRLLVAKKSGHDFRIIDSFSRVVHLGENLSRSKELSEQAMSRTLQALKICAQKLGKNQVHKYRAVATAACRAAMNSHEFLNLVQTETGLSLEIISAEEESRLSASACTTLMEDRFPYYLVFDIGGGSTEFCWTKKTDDSFHLINYLSIPYGVTNVMEDPNTPVSQERNQQIVTMIKEFDVKNNITQMFLDKKVQAIGNSGTVTALAAVNMNLKVYDRAKVDGYRFPRQDILETSNAVCNMTSKERVKNTCIGHDRADYMIAGCDILTLICKHWPIENLYVADRGLREGILYDFLY